MDLRLLEIFCSVYQERSFSRAADKLHLTQPTVSEHIRTLEEQFNVKLFDRLGKSIQPTKAGELLYSYGRQVLELKRAAVEGMKKFLNRLEGELVIGASTIPGEYILPRIIAAFHREHAGVEVVLRISDTKGVTSWLLAGEVEAGFVGARIDDHSLAFEEFASDRLVLAVPNQREWRQVSSISLDKLREKPLVIREPGSGTRAMFERQLAQHGYSLDDFKVVAVVGSTNAVKEAIKAGIGVSVLSSLAVRGELASRLFKQVQIKEIKSPRRSFYIAVDKRRLASPICQAFLEYVRRARQEQRVGA